MNPFDVCIAYVSWDVGGKHRPVLLLEKNDGYAEAFRITSQYEGKSETIKAQYFKIDDWQQAGLSKESYIDTIASVEVPIALITSTIGKLTDNDKQRLIKFLND
jgi:hypothetical protein